MAQPPQSGEQGQGGWNPIPTPSRPTRRATGPLLIGLLIGLLIAVGAAAILIAVGGAHLGSTQSASVDTRPITLPATLGGLRDQIDVVGTKTTKPEQIQAQKDRIQHTTDRTVSAYQKAYGGASAAVGFYSDDDLKFLPTVIAVRAASPGLVDGPDVDPADLELAFNQKAIQAFGDVQCQMYSDKGVIPAGQPVDQSALGASVCFRTGREASVWVYGPGEGTSGQQQMVALTNAAWAAVSGT